MGYFLTCTSTLVAISFSTSVSYVLLVITENEYVQDEPTEPDISEKPTDVRPFIRKRTATNNNNKKQQPFVQLALMKQEWVQAELSTTTLQKQYLTEEHEWKKRKYELEIQQMEEKHRLELQILQQKCFEFIPVEIQE